MSADVQHLAGLVGLKLNVSGGQMSIAQRADDHRMLLKPPGLPPAASRTYARWLQLTVFPWDACILDDVRFAAAAAAVPARARDVLAG